MATITTTADGRVLQLVIDGVDLTPHIMAEPAPVVRRSGDSEFDVFVVDLRLSLDTVPAPRRLCDPMPPSEVR